MTEADNTLLLSNLRDIRTDMREQRALLFTLTEFTRRLDRRMDQLDQRLADLKDDLELMIRSELLGRLAHRDTVMDEKLEQLADRVAALEAKG